MRCLPERWTSVLDATGSATVSRKQKAKPLDDPDDPELNPIALLIVVSLSHHVCLAKTISFRAGFGYLLVHLNYRSISDRYGFCLTKF
jgi:hypothetical protein